MKREEAIERHRSLSFSPVFHCVSSPPSLETNAHAQMSSVAALKAQAEQGACGAIDPGGERERDGKAPRRECTRGHIPVSPSWPAARRSIRLGTPAPRRPVGQVPRLSVNGSARGKGGWTWAWWGAQAAARAPIGGGGRGRATLNLLPPSLHPSVCPPTDAHSHTLSLPPSPFAHLQPSPPFWKRPRPTWKRPRTRPRPSWTACARTRLRPGRPWSRMRGARRPPWTPGSATWRPGRWQRAQVAWWPCSWARRAAWPGASRSWAWSRPRPPRRLG
jgi:hypothetical protein